MNPALLRPRHLRWFFSLATVFSLLAAPASAVREKILFDQDWRFAFGHPSDPAKDFYHATGYFSYLAKTGFGDGPAAADYDDRAWRELDLPHDWAVEAPFSVDGSHSHGYKAAGKGFPDRSVGWYRKRFFVPESDLGRHLTVQLDGVFRAGRVWVNGFYLGEQPSGYTGIEYDLTDYLNYGGENVISIRADATLEEGWFYEGAGVYRHVWLVKTNPVHVAANGTYITTVIEDNHARVSIETEVRHTGREPIDAVLEHMLLGPDGEQVGSTRVENLVFQPGQTVSVAAATEVNAPQLWSHHTPQLYRAVTTLRSGDAVIDRYESTFGIRDIRFDPNEGFFINGEHVKLKGVNVHQDHAGLGAALPDAMFDYRLRRLKEFGVNAVRTGHRPPATEFLEACDRLGLYVIDEHRLMGVNPAQMNDLRDMIRRDRNHPSIILWSIGNEEWAIEGNVLGARITQRMQDYVQRFEPTRRVTVAISGGWGGSSTVADVVGYNYINQSDPDQQHADFPHQPGLGTEETSTQSTRGIFFDDPAKGHMGPREAGDTGGNNEKGWTYYAARPFLAGMFYWTGFDYRGEPTPFAWPAVSSQFGLLDLCGYEKDSTYYQKSWWTDEPVLHLSPHWNWAGREGEPMKVVVYSNHESVELLLNGESLGRRDMPRLSKLTWQVPYAAGRLEARAYRGDDVVQTAVRETTGIPTQLTVDAMLPTTGKDGRRIVVFTVGAEDASGRAVPTADPLATFAVEGGTIIGVGNGNPGSHEADRFVPEDTLLPIADWRGRIAPADTAVPAIPTMLEPMRPLGAWGAPVPQAGEFYDLTGTFTAGELPADATIDLYLPVIGQRCTIWLNGEELGRDLDTSTTGAAFTLTPGQLEVGENRIQMFVTAFDGPTRLPERDDMGTVRFRTPAPTPQRHLFSGLAQVIVEADSESDRVKLTATADGLTVATLDVPVAKP